MAGVTVSNTFSTTMEAYTTSTQAHADVFNNTHSQLLSNDNYLNINANAMKAAKGPFTVTGFTQSSAPYTATLTNSNLNVTTGDSPIVSFYTNGSNLGTVTPKQQKKAFSCVDRVVTSGTNAITFYCYSKKPANDFQVMVKGK